jgi:hypothetical protein
MPEQLYLLALLACPVAMGLLMWIMMRGKQQQAPTATDSSHSELARLRAEVDQLRAEREHHSDRRQTESDHR